MTRDETIVSWTRSKIDWIRSTFASVGNRYQPSAIEQLDEHGYEYSFDFTDHDQAYRVTIEWLGEKIGDR